MHAPEIEFTDDGVACLPGDVTIRTAASLYREWNDHSRQHGTPQVVDLSRVAQIDSAGLALLLEWQSVATNPDLGEVALEIRNPPSALTRIARLCDALPYLNPDLKSEIAQAT